MKFEDIAYGRVFAHGSSPYHFVKVKHISNYDALCVEHSLVCRVSAYVREWRDNEWYECNDINIHMV